MSDIICVTDRKTCCEDFLTRIERIAELNPKAIVLRAKELTCGEYKALAEKYGILISGGSDFHGPSIREPLELGIFTIEDKYAEKFYREEDI